VRAFLHPGLDTVARREMAAGSQAITGGNQLDTFANQPVHDSGLDDSTATEILEILDGTRSAVNFGQDFDLDLEQLTLRDVARDQGIRSPSYGEQARAAVHRTAASLQERVSGVLADGMARVRDATDTTNELYGRVVDEHGSLADAYLAMIDEKTVDLYVASIAIGAVIGGATRQQRELLRDAMRDIGRAFQIQDDYLEIEESVEQTGKKPTDIINGKLTLASISTYESLNTVLDVLGGRAERFNVEDLVADHRETIGAMTHADSYQAAVSEVNRLLDRGEQTVHRLLEAGIDLTAYGEGRVFDYLDPELLQRDREAVRADRATFLDTYGNLSTLRPGESFRQVTAIMEEYSYGKEMAEDMLESAKETLDKAQQEEGLDPAYTDRLKGLADYMLERSH
ncbi:MAG: polyprenyl synthetase family protein, partial [Candidatus Nanohaloarchaea archaeon]|nr:polyprenyl synthetase family protein [Candidatus Nanohaloarchaea archaeon]